MPHHHVDMSAQDRAARALDMRVKGCTWEAIANACGYGSRTTAFNAAQALLDKRVTPAVEDYRKLADMRLDAMRAAVWDRAMGEMVIDAKTGAYEKTDPDPEYLAILLKIEARHAKLWGLDTKPDLGDFLPGQVLIREIAAPLDKV